MSDLMARVAEEQARPLPPAGVAALLGELWPGGELVANERLVGGLATGMHRLDVVTADGGRDAVVVRLFLAAWGGDTSAFARREHATLARLTTVRAPAPEPRWLDATGTVLGAPALAMSLVPGGPLVSRRPPDVVALAGALAAVHAVTPADVDHLPPAGDLATQVRQCLPDRDPGPAAFVDVDDLSAAIDAWVGSYPPARPCLVHGDYHAGNVLSDGATVTVVDWTWARSGDPGFDLAYCRYDLALANGPDVADAFTEAYLAAGGPAAPSAGWDLVAVASSLPTPGEWLRGFHEHGRLDCTADGFEVAGRAFLADALRRLG